MTPPLFYRLVFNPVRAWLERDERLLIQQWKDAFGPKPKKVLHMNLLVSRDQRRKVNAA